MTPAQLLEFAEEIGAQPTRIEVSAPHWRDVLLESCRHQHYSVHPPSVASVASVHYCGIHIVYDPNLEPGAFEFRYE